MFASLKEAEAFEKLERLRNGIIHGYRDVEECIDVARANLELVRTALMAMIMQILGVSEHVKKAVEELGSIKGKYMPHMKVVTTAECAPGSYDSLVGHPRLETKVEIRPRVSDDGTKLHITPEWKYTVRDAERVTFRRYEIWGEAGRDVQIDVGEPK